LTPSIPPILSKGELMKKNFLKRYGFYLIRWQLSTPILAIALVYLASLGEFWATVIANLIGGLIFFWIDKLIFRKKSKLPKWEIQQGVCIDCGRKDLVYRIVEWGKYDRSDAEPQWRCRECSLKKMENISH
jgi:hypothetical protein